MASDYLDDDGDRSQSWSRRQIVGDTFTSYPTSVVERSSDRTTHYYFRSTALLVLAVIVAIVVIAAGFAVAIFQYFRAQNDSTLGGILVILGSLALASVILLGGTFFVRGLQSKELAKIRESESNLEPDPPGAIPSANRVAITEADLNRQSLNTYQSLTQKQASGSYRMANVAIFIGFAILIAGAYVAINAIDVTAQVIVGVLAALGSAISGYIGATSIRMYQRAQAQMNFYYAQPLVQSYILQAERLTDKLSKARKDPSVEKIIDRTLQGASVAAVLIARGSDEPTTIPTSPSSVAARASSEAAATSLGESPTSAQVSTD